jgi:DNA repair protein RecO
MAERNSSFDALILRTKDSPSGDRIATMLGAEEGIVDAFVFGGAKSSLKSTASPFIHARAFIYTDPVKQYRKLSDLSVLESFPGLRDSYDKLMAASTISELLIKTSACGGENGAVFDLALRSLRLLDLASEAQVELLLLGFLWKVLDIMGLEPDLDRCSACGRQLGAPRGEGGKRSLRYSASQGGFLCPSCGGSFYGDTASEYASLGDNVQELGEDSESLLRAFSEKPMEALPAFAGSAPLPASLRSFVRALAQTAAEGGLRCLSEN